MENNYIQTAEEALLHTYNRYQIVLEKGDGAYLYDVDGKEYLDFAAGIAVCSLGYGHPKYKEALKNQIDDLMHTSNLFYSIPVANAAKSLKKATQMDRVFFTNSGTEAIEGALKAARKYAYTKGSGKYEFIAMNHSFHGRSMGALAVTGTEHYRTPFEPLIGGVKFAEFNNLESVKAQITDKTCAILLEPVQGEGGIYPAEKEFLEGLRKLCDEKGLLLLLDEVQTGWCRTGAVMSYMNYGIKPDIVSMAKALGGGMPIGAICAREEVAKAFTPGSHGTTFGGHPVCCAAALAEVNELLDRNCAQNAKEMGDYFSEKLKSLPHVKDVRHQGLLVGVEFDETVNSIDVKHECLHRKLLLTAIGEKVIRMVPPLIITKEDCDKAYEIIKESVMTLTE